MIEYCLDTNVCIALINGSSLPVRSRFKAALAEDSVICVSTVVLHELWYGVSKSAKKESNTERMYAFLAGPFEILPWDDADARAAGEVRAQLEGEANRVGPEARQRGGRRASNVGAYDALIAAQAVRRGITLVTANTREFQRVDGLMWEDWARPLKRNR